ncbi:DUF4297 family anti-phage-associated protein [Metabacillus bambusae]|uniref:Restriction endonuclease n=1 Tax=Metabacillus bambusae TaxID=2795218 RepID=A0ABS3N775_9BACI|nr:DUF4297 family anti-phage-associated protein [Metabacillus bambusae]MBO1514084.1 hypothetical protein [Metabacillus bambusae]
MSNRSATDTITGYFYQFDYSISKLLELPNNNDSITIEGIEDIDIKTLNDETAIQCKYYAKSEYNHSVIGKPIRLMLNHYKEVKDGLKPSINYYLYGHYKRGHEKLILPLSVDFLKTHFLTYKKEGVEYLHHEDLGLDDTDLNVFISRLSIDIMAKNYDFQFSEILEQLRGIFNCTLFDAENYYYNNSLKVIKELSIQGDVENRTIYKMDFIKKIDNKQFLFNEWLSFYKGKESLLRKLRTEYFTFLNTSPFERFFLIEAYDAEYIRADVKELLHIVSAKWSNLSKRTPTPFCPYIYIHNIASDELVQIKQELQREGFNFTDGYSFMGSSFSPILICQEANAQNHIQLKIVNSLDDLEETIKETRKTKEIYQFFKNTTFYNTDTPGIKNVKIQYEKFNDIREII